MSGIIIVATLVMLGLALILFLRQKLLVSTIVAYPAFMIFWSIVFPGMNYRLEEALFPIIDIGFFRVRIDELVFYTLAGVWLNIVFLSKVTRKHVILHLSGWTALLLLFVYGWIILSLLIGLVNKNLFVGTDFRFITPTLVGLPMATWALRRIERSTLIWIVKLTVTFLLVSNLLLISSYIFITQGISYLILLQRNLPSFGFTIIFFVGLFSLIIFNRLSLILLLGLFMPLSLAIFEIHKWWVLGIIIGTLYVSYGAVLSKSSFHLNIKKFRKIVLFGLIIGIFTAFVGIILPEMSENSLNKLKERILRQDVDEDFSGGRFLIWKSITKHIFEHPIIGHGLGFRLKGFLPTEEEAEGQYIEDHNIVLWSAVRFGIFFVLLLFFLFFRFLQKGLWTYRTNVHKFEKILILSCISNFIVIMSMSMIGQWILIFEINIIFCWSIAVVLAFGLQKQVRMKTYKEIGFA